jgi:hypothetical protein
MLDAGPAQPDQVDAPRAVSVEDLARGRDTRSAPSAECAADAAATPARLDAEGRAVPRQLLERHIFAVQHATQVLSL